MADNKTPENSGTDLRIFWRAFKDRLLYIITAGILCAIVAGLFGNFRYVPKYASSVSLLIHVDEVASSQLSQYDINNSSRLINTVEAVLRYSDEFTADLNETAGTSGMYSDSDIGSLMKFEQILTGTPTLRVTFVSTNRNAAYNLAKSFEMKAADEIKKYVSVSEVVIFNKASLASSPYNGNPCIKYATLGFLAGGVAMYIVFLVAAMLDTKIHEEKDLTEISDYPILGVVPAFHRERAKQEKRHNSDNDLFGKSNG